mmetsp:Transcript_6637/g.15105  ORF Transcript_6637/g.15105 Transcript_6637/m.15105 type:complete len:299 (+) Transcript_6637:2038-2934(+)
MPPRRHCSIPRRLSLGSPKTYSHPRGHNALFSWKPLEGRQKGEQRTPLAGFVKERKAKKQSRSRPTSPVRNTEEGLSSKEDDEVALLTGSVFPPSTGTGKLSLKGLRHDLLEKVGGRRAPGVSGGRKSPALGLGGRKSPTPKSPQPSPVASTRATSHLSMALPKMLRLKSLQPERQSPMEHELLRSSSRSFGQAESDSTQHESDSAQHETYDRPQPPPPALLTIPTATRPGDHQTNEDDSKSQGTRPSFVQRSDRSIWLSESSSELTLPDSASGIVVAMQLRMPKTDEESLRALKIKF